MNNRSQDFRHISDVLKTLPTATVKAPRELSEVSTASSNLNTTDTELAYLEKVRRARNGRTVAGRLIALDLCSGCGSTRNLQRHHKNGEPWDNSESNIVVLCGSCHRFVHEGLWRRA